MESTADICMEHLPEKENPDPGAAEIHPPLSRTSAIPISSGVVTLILP